MDILLKIALFIAKWWIMLISQCSTLQGCTGGIILRKDFLPGMISVSLAYLMSDPLLILGDFDAVFDVEHRVNGELITHAEIHDFVYCLDSN